MRRNLSKIAAALVALSVIGSIYLVTLHAQPNGNKSTAPALTTNWFGCLVVGQDDQMDQIYRGPHPTSIPHVQIGLRSDGVVVWRNAPTAK